MVHLMKKDGAKKQFSLECKVSIVTGAGRGLGKAMALALANAGSTVACADMDLKGAEETADQISKLGRKAVALRADVTSEQDIQNMIDTTVEQFGRIDILVNNAGIHIGGEFPPEDLDRQYWDKTIAVNLTGAFLCAQAAGRQMIKQKSGRIINISSISALVVNRLTDRHPISYCVSKAGLTMLTKTLAVEWAEHNITVNAIAPAYTKTAILHPDPAIRAEMVNSIPMARLGEPEDVAGTVVYLASDASRFVTGHTLVIDGGLTCW